MKLEVGSTAGFSLVDSILVLYSWYPKTNRFGRNDPPHPRVNVDVFQHLVPLPPACVESKFLWDL